MKAKNLEIGYLAYFKSEEMPVLITGFKGEINESGTLGKFQINHSWYVDAKDIVPLDIKGDILIKLGFMRLSPGVYYHTTYQLHVNFIDDSYWRFAYAQYHLRVNAIHHIQRLYDDINHVIPFKDEIDKWIKELMQIKLTQDHV